MNNKKTITILMIATIIITIIGGTFAYWNWQSTSGQKTNVTFTVASGFTCGADAGGDITSSDVTLAPAACTNPEYAIQRTVRVSTTQDAGKAISLDMWLKVNNIDSGLSQSENFKYALTTNSSSCTTDVITSGAFTGATNGSQFNLLEDKQYNQTTASDVYYLYIWLDSAETNQNTMNQSFNITIEGSCTDDVTIEETAVYADFGNSYELFKGYSYYSNITTIEFVNYTNTDGLSGINSNQNTGPSYIPSGGNDFSTSKMGTFDTKFLLGVTNTEATEHLDEYSPERTADVVGWFEEDSNSLGNYILKIGANADKIYVRNLSSAFSSLALLENIININMLDTSKTVNMSDMFDLQKMSSLDLSLSSNFNTINVTDMSDMFYGMENLRSLNLGNHFNTSNVTNMALMFSTIALTEECLNLDLGAHFNTSKVTNMSGMFSVNGDYGTPYICSINLGNHFDTRNVIDMSYMFGDLYYLEELDASSVDFTNVSNYDYIFGGIPNTANIYVKDAANQQWVINAGSDNEFSATNVLIK